MNELQEAKRKLYNLLLKKTGLTENEIDIMYHLALDSDIQSIIDEVLIREHNLPKLQTLDGNQS